MHLEIREEDGEKKYYLSHSYRENEKVKKIRIYLGRNLNKNELNHAIQQAKDRMEKEIGEKKAVKELNRSRLLKMGLTAMVILISVSVLFTFLHSDASTSGSVLISLTDPANVPAGTQVLNITWSALAVQTVSSNGSSWTSVGSQGSVNLLELQNSSLGLGSFSASNDTRIDAIKFNITSASIEINDTVYPVYLTNNQIVSQVSGEQSVNNTTEVLIDISPTVVPIFNSNSTEFLMMVSAETCIAPRSVNIENGIGKISMLNQRDIFQLDYVRANITITNVSLSVSGNMTNLVIDLIEESNQTVVINNVVLLGNESVNLPIIGNASRFFINQSTIIGGPNQSVITGGINGPNGFPQIGNPIWVSVQSSGAMGFGFGQGGPAFDINPGTLNTLPIQEETLISVGQNQAEFQEFDFLVNSSGNLSPAYLQCEQRFNGNPYFVQSPFMSICPNYVNYLPFYTGDVLKTNQTAELSFNGEMQIGNGNLFATVVPGDMYTIVVEGSYGARAQANVIVS